jgi:predicted nucleic acid-binding protein
MERTTITLPRELLQRLRRRARHMRGGSDQGGRRREARALSPAAGQHRNRGLGADGHSAARRRGACGGAAVALILDTGPLYASPDRSAADHATCRRLIEEAEEPLVIPAPVLVKADYWIHLRLHAGVLVALLDDVVTGAYRVEELQPQDYRRIRELCDRYADSDIGFVDAAVLAVVERLGEPKLAALDHRHFHSLRPRHVDTMKLLPEPGSRRNSDPQ